MLQNIRKKLRQLASLLPTAYTEFAAIHDVGGEMTRRRGHVRYGNPA
jgi:hypothetical protein